MPTEEFRNEILRLELTERNLQTGIFGPTGEFAKGILRLEFTDRNRLLQNLLCTRDIV